MNFNNLLNQFTGSMPASVQGTLSQGIAKAKGGMGSGLLGGAAAGGIMGLLVGSKKTRKFAGKAATVGGAALLGGIAFKAYKSWQQNSSQTDGQAQLPTVAEAPSQASFEQPMSEAFQLTLIKSMIVAAKADGHIDQQEQNRIFQAVEQMGFDAQTKGLIFDLLRQPIYIQELVHGAQTMEQKAEVYLASCLTIGVDNSAEEVHLEQLRNGLGLPSELAQQIRLQAKQALSDESFV